VQAEGVQGAAVMEVERPVDEQVGGDGGEVGVQAVVAGNARVQGQVDVHVGGQGRGDIQPENLSQRHLRRGVVQVDEQVALERGCGPARVLGEAELEEEQLDRGVGVFLQAGGQADLQLWVLAGGSSRRVGGLHQVGDAVGISLVEQQADAV